MPRSYTPLITSVGIEIEFTNIPIHLVKDNRKISRIWKIVRDGTCSRNKIMLPNGDEIVFSQRNQPTEVNLYGLKTEPVGGEFVSPIFNIETKNWYDPVLYVLDVLKELGEGVNLRTGIHVHINIQMPPIYVIQNLVKLALNLEAPMYRLSCAELGFHRGSEYKDYMFCRPLSSPGPQVIRDSEREWRPIFDAKNLLKVENLNEFFMACGRLDINGGNKWHQTRYTWLNFAAILLHRTIEWRIFNSTLELDNLLAWVELCSNLVSYSFGKNIELREFPLGNSKLDAGSEYSFEDFLIDAYITDDNLAERLENLWYLGSWQSKVKGHQKGHLGHSLELDGLTQKFIKKYLAKPVDIEEIVDFDQLEQEPHPEEGTRPAHTTMWTMPQRGRARVPEEISVDEEVNVRMRF